MSTSFPPQYLVITHSSSGDQTIIPIADGAPLDLRTHVDAWAKSIGEEIMGDIEQIPGEYHAAIVTEGRGPTDPDAIYQDGNFWLKI